MEYQWSTQQEAELKAKFARAAVKLFEAELATQSAIKSNKYSREAAKTQSLEML